MEVRIIGVDAGTANTGWCHLVGDMKSRKIYLQAFGMLTTSKEDGDVRARIDMLGYALRNRIKDNGATHLAVEDFTEQGKIVGKTYKEMSWLTEHFRMVGREMGVETDIYPNAYWKKVLLKAPHASKVQVEHYVRMHLAEAHSLKVPNHVWDSIAVGLCKFKLLTT